VIISDPAVTADGLEYHIQTPKASPRHRPVRVCCLPTRSAGRCRRCRSLGYAAGTCDGSADGCNAPMTAAPGTERLVPICRVWAG